jgi:hypothetical protein
MKSYGKKMAVLATSLFFLAGIVSLSVHAVRNDIDWTVSLPLTVFYVMLCTNTYFSVKLFSSIMSRADGFNIFIDGMLVAFYFALAWFLYNPNAFIIATCVLFALATLKYVNLRIQKKYDTHSSLIGRKIVLDCLGFFYSFMAYAGSILADTHSAVWLWTIGFAIANIYLLVLKPFYVVH